MSGSILTLFDFPFQNNIPSETSKNGRTKETNPSQTKSGLFRQGNLSTHFKPYEI